MASIAPLRPLYRSFSIPKLHAARHCLRFSTSTTCRATPHIREDPNLVASRTAPPSYPPHSMKSLPRPKESRASRRTSHPRKVRPYPTRQPSHQQPQQLRLVPEPTIPLAPELSAPNLAYYVTRTRSNELPVYCSVKRGGNLLLTQVRKIDGKKEILRDELRQLLGVASEDAVVNGTTGHIIIKGHYKPEIVQFLRERRF